MLCFWHDHNLVCGPARAKAIAANVSVRKNLSNVLRQNSEQEP